jgi:hypothetical protein
MEYYTLDDSLRRDSIIEGYQSIIWTERYAAYGDFQIITVSNLPNRRLLSIGTWITRLGSNYVGIIDTVSDAVDDDGIKLITVSGSFLEKLLNDRVAMPALTDTTTQPNWVLTGTPGAIGREMFNQVCVSAVIDVHDSIPFYTFGTLLPTGNIPEPSEIITVTMSPDTLYNSLQSLCNAYTLGFRLVKDEDSGQIYFEIYTGNDLTSNQKEFNPVIFDPGMENLAQTTVLQSTAALKTVAYVFATNGSAMVYAPWADALAYGTDRRVLLVNSDNDGDAGDALTIALQQEGIMALAAQAKIYAFDGELPPNCAYIYGADYNLGDLVEERNSDDNGNQMIVTEQIFSSDNTADTTYPTLTLKQVITPDSWDAVFGAESWSDIPDTTDWDDLS